MQTQDNRLQPHVLLIDDDFESLDVLGQALQLKGYDVDIACDGYQGLERLRASPRCDYVICDLGMPGMNGWTVAEKVASISPQTKVFMLTGWAREILPGDPRRKLVVDVLAKPLDLDAIDAALAKAR